MNGGFCPAYTMEPRLTTGDWRSVQLSPAGKSIIACTDATRLWSVSVSTVIVMVVPSSQLRVTSVSPRPTTGNAAPSISPATATTVVRTRLIRNLQKPSATDERVRRDATEDRAAVRRVNAARRIGKTRWMPGIRRRVRSSAKRSDLAQGVARRHYHRASPRGSLRFGRHAALHRD